MVTLSCMAFWLAAIPPDVPFDGDLALRSAEQAAEEGHTTRDNNWTRLAVVHLRLGHWERAEWAINESMARRNGGDRFDWTVQALFLARRGEVDQAHVWFRRASGADDGGNGPGVGYGEVRDEVATLLGLPLGSHEGHRRGPSEVRNEASPLPRGTLSVGKPLSNASLKSERRSR